MRKEGIFFEVLKEQMKNKLLIKYLFMFLNYNKN